MCAAKREFKCKNNPQKFCYACGIYIFTTPVKFTASLQIAFRNYFEVGTENLNKPWVPNVLCNSCKTCLARWMAGNSRYLSFDKPVIWNEPFCHAVDCYFCLTEVQQHGRHKSVQYAEVQSVVKPTPHSHSKPYPICPKRKWESADCNVQLDNMDSESEVEFETKPSIFSQEDLNDLVRDLELTKDKSELLASRLKERNLLLPSVKVSHYRNRDEQFAKYFSKKNNACYCHDVNGLFEEFGELHDPNEWRLFIDSSKLSLKAVLLHIGNCKPSIPLAHAVNMKESYKSLALILNLINYNQHSWKICSDLKVVAMLTGLQPGYTKYMCFLCKWDSRARKQHYIEKEWPKRTSITLGKENIQSIPLVDKDRIILPPLHIKLGLFKNLVKALQKNGPAFQYLKSVFPNLSDAKIKEGVFVGPQIKKLIGDQRFCTVLSPDELEAWKSFRLVVTNFLGNTKSEDHAEIVRNLLENYRKIGVNMSLKIHFLHSHLDFFPPNLGDESDEHGERFHQQMKQIERRYQGFWDESMLGDYCWFLVRQTNTTYKRRSSNMNHF